MLALGRGLMAQPDLLLLDEPSQGLGPRIVELIFEAIDRIRRQRRLAIRLVKQRVVEALELCDRATCWRPGGWCWRGRATRCWPTRGCSARTSERNRHVPWHIRGGHDRNPPPHRDVSHESPGPSSLMHLRQPQGHHL